MASHTTRYYYSVSGIQDTDKYKKLQILKSCQDN